MAHITLPEGLPGMRAAMAFRPETAKPLNELANILLHEPNSLSRGDRELIATYVSSQNDCYFCQTIHGAIAAHHLGRDQGFIHSIKCDFSQSEISSKLKALLVIAGKVQQGGKFVTTGDVENARLEGATDTEIHDTVLIAAFFCLCNRYVDGLATSAPEDPEYYETRAPKVAAEGYSMDPTSGTQPAKSD